MKKINWIQIANEIFLNKAQLKPFTFKSALYDFQIFGYENTRMGFMIIWQISSGRAVRISRMKIPQEIQFVTMSENENTYNDLVPRDLKFEDMHG